VGEVVEIEVEVEGFDLPNASHLACFPQTFRTVNQPLSGEMIQKNFNRNFFFSSQLYQHLPAHERSLQRSTSREIFQ
jgi:hypothetical protein